MARTPTPHPTNGWDVFKTAIICLTICIGTMVSTAQDLRDGSEAKIGGISIVGVAGALAAVRKAGWL